MNSDAHSPSWTLHESATSSVVIHVPHAGVAIPDNVRSGLLLTDDELREELAVMTDHRTDAIASAAAAVCDVSVIVNQLSRLVVDPERFPDEREEMLAVGMGAVYTQTSRRQSLRHANAERDARLLAEYFVPYSAAVAALVERVLDRHGTCTIIDLHSYPTEPLPYELRPAAHRPGTCIGTDSVHTPEHLRDAALAAFADVGGGAAVDTPFSGTYVPTQHFRHDMRVTSVMIEIRRDLYADERGVTDGRDIAALATRLARLAGTAARAQ